MKNNILGFVVYLLAAIIFYPSTAVILLAIKENSDRCHYYNGAWSKSDLMIGCTSIALGGVIRYLLYYCLNIDLTEYLVIL